jgi:HSP20 family molecular chaperone IbpA
MNLKNLKKWSRTMNEDAPDIFREMDALADHLFARVAGSFDADIPQEYGYRIAIWDDDTLQAPSVFPKSYPLPEVCEPVPEVHRTGNEVMVIAELPGATKDSVHLAVAGDQLTINTDGGVSQYHTTVALPRSFRGQ